jgi:hypothetical protein
MIRNTFIVLVAVAIIIFIGLKSNTIHYPILSTLLSAILLGYLQPKKGWINALQLIVGIFAGYFACKIFGLQPLNNTTFQFITFISPLPCLFGGFMGSFFSNAINQNDNRRSPKNR